MSSPSESAQPVALKRSYGCFISYVPEDNQQVGRRWATWLQYQVIEKFKVPPGLVGRTNSRGETIPERIWPSFAEDMVPAEPELSPVIRRALEGSRMLVVICSPRAAQSAQVAAQIRYFKQMGLGDSILAVVIDGELETHESSGIQGCFPLPLLHPLDAQGNLLRDQEAFPLAFDFRLADGSQGWTSPELYRDNGGTEVEVTAYAGMCDKTKLRVLADVMGVEVGEVEGRAVLRAPASKPNANRRVNLPIGMILHNLPREVLAADLSKFETTGVAATEIGLPMERILGQLPSGKVEMTVQELIPPFPPGYLLPTDAIADYLPTIVSLPLMDLVMRVPPDLLAPRPDQKDVSASAINMADPFTEQILREQAESLRRQQVEHQPQMVEESLAPQEEFVPSPAAVEIAAEAARSATLKKEDLVYDENVQFTVYRPKVVAPGKWHTMLAFAHLAEKAADAPEDAPDPVKEVARQAKQVLGHLDAYGESRQDSSQAIPREGEITMVPEVEGIKFNPPRRSFLWDEPVHREEFRLMTKDVAIDAPITLRGRMTIFLSSLIIAEIPLVFRVDSAQEPASAQPTEPAHARPYRKVFASYSHRDMAVVEHIEHYAHALGDTYLRDIVHLKSGEEWNPRLLAMIEEADIFQLFWSTNSMKSPYVRQEWEYALGLNRPNFIRPTFWEDPLPELPSQGLPPETLRRFHFQKIASDRLPASAPSEPDDVVVPATAMAASVMAVTPRPAPPAPSDTTSIVPVASSGRPYAPSGESASSSRPPSPAPAMAAAQAASGGRRSGFGWQKIVAVVAVVAVVGGLGVHQFGGTSRSEAFAGSSGPTATAVEPSAPPPSPPQNESLATAPAPAAPPPDQNPQESVPDTHAGRDAASSDWEEIAIKMLEVAALLVVLFAVVYVMYRRHGRH